MANHDVPAAVAAAVAAVFEGETTAETAAEDGHHQEDLSETDPGRRYFALLVLWWFVDLV